MPIYKNGINISLNTDDITQGSVNEWSKWDSLVQSGTDYVRAIDSRRLIVGPEEGVDTILASASGATAVFTEPGAGGGALNFFTNSSVGAGGFAPLGGLFLSTRARGTWGSETAAQAGDLIGGYAGAPYDGSSYSLNFGGTFVLPGVWLRAETTPVADSYSPSIGLGSSNGTNVFEVIMRNGTSGEIGFFGATPVVRTGAYTPTNVVADRAYNANATTVEELADVLGTVIADLQSYGLLQ